MPTAATALTLKRIYDFIGPRVALFLGFGVITGIGFFFIELCLAYGLQAFVGSLTDAQAGTLVIPKWIPTNPFSHVITFIAVVAIIRGFFVWAQQYSSMAINEEFRFLQRSRILRWSFHSRSSNSIEAMNLINERTTFAGSVVKETHIIAVQATSLVLIMGALFYISWKLTFIAIGFLLILGVPVFTLTKACNRSGKALTNEWDSLSKRLFMGIKNILLLRIYDMQSEEEKLTQKNVKSYLDHILFFCRASATLYSLPQMLGLLVICFSSWIGQSMLNMPGALLITYFFLFVRMLHNVSMISSLMNTFSFYWPQVYRLENWWHESKKEDFASASSLETPSITISRNLGWELKDLSFRYPNSDRYILSNANLEIPPGSCVALVGQSGAGKSTVLNLLLGELDPTEGSLSVLAGNATYDVRNIKSQMLQKVGYVGPESFLLEGSIKENLLYGLREKVSDEEILRTLKLAECNFIDQFDAGIGHHLTEHGQGLSAGQKQRISLARALLRKPSILILDEPTANLDIITEEKLTETFKTLKSSMTIVLASHRPAILKIADEVYSIDNGQIIKTPKTVIETRPLNSTSSLVTN